MSNQFQNQVQGNYVSATQGMQSAPRQTPAPNLDFISTDNRENEYREALKHSSKVKFWKIAFPIIAIVLVLGIIGAFVLNSLKVPDVSVENINLSDGKLVMENPKLNGFDKNKRPYNLTATKAIQDVSNPNQVELQEILAELPMDEKITATITAGNGVYDADAKTLILKETVNLVTSSGMVLNLQDANVDIGNSIMHTNNPINGTSAQADISSNAMMIEDGGNKLIFEGRVRMTLRPDEAKKADTTNE